MLASISASGCQETHRGMCAMYRINLSHAGSGASNRCMSHRYDRCDSVSHLQHTRSSCACRLSRVQMDLRRKISRTLAFPLRCALIERSGQSSLATSNNSARWLNRNTLLSNDRDRHRPTSHDELIVWKMNIHTWGRRHGACQGVSYRSRREHQETIVPQLTIEEQVEWTHKLTRAVPLWRRS